MRPVLGVFTTSPALSDPTGDHPAGLDPDTGLTEVDDVSAEAYLRAPVTGDVYWVGPAFITNDDIESAEAALPPGGVQAWVVIPQFTTEGAAKFRAATATMAQEPVASPTRRIAIVVDGEVIEAPILAAEVGPEGLDPNHVVIDVGFDDDPDSEQRAVELASALSR